MKEQLLFPPATHRNDPAPSCIAETGPACANTEVPSFPASRRDPVLFDTGLWWDDLWQGMPEFVHEDLEPWSSIKVHFACPADMRVFARLVGQPITARTQSLWHPEAEIGKMADKRYADGA